METDWNIPEEMAVMVLPETVLLPGGLLPLFIFEPRYREMVSDALASHRMFAIGLMRDGQVSYPVGCAGFIRACVARPDGTSHLMLQGMRRVSFVEWLDKKPYPLARIRVLQSCMPAPSTGEGLRGEFQSLSRQLPIANAEMRQQLETLLEKAADLSQFSDLAASAIVSDATIRQHILEELIVENRLAILAACLTRIITPE